VVIANTDTLAIYDAGWNLLRRVSHPWTAGVHDILAEEDGIWITCTHADLLVKIDWNGRLLRAWDWREDGGLVAELGLPPLPFVDRAVDHRDPDARVSGVRNVVHLNAISRGREGWLLSFGRILSPATYRKHAWDARYRQLVTAAGAGRWMPRSLLALRGRLGSAESMYGGSTSCIVLLPDDGAAKVLHRTSGGREPNHNVLQLDDGLVYNDTNSASVVLAPLDRSEVRRVVPIPGQPGFVRGLAHLGGRIVLVGSQAPAAIYEVDLDQGRILSHCELGTAGEAIYALCRLPPEFGAGPAGAHGDVTGRPEATAVGP
jgi:hypothetical protein